MSEQTYLPIFFALFFWGASLSTSGLDHNNFVSDFLSLFLFLSIEFSPGDLSPVCRKPGRGQAFTGYHRLTFF